MTSFAKFLVQGRDASAVLQPDLRQRCRCADRHDRLHRHAQRARRLRKRPHLMRLGAKNSSSSPAPRKRCTMPTGSSRTFRPTPMHVLTDVTSSYAVLAVMGPRSRELLAKRVVGGSLATTLPLRHHPRDRHRLRDGASHPPDLCRRTRLGTDRADGIRRRRLRGAARRGPRFGLLDAGYYAIDALRIEKGYRAWGRELTPDINPWQAGLAFAVAIDKPGGFIGRDALLEAANGGAGASASCCSRSTMPSRCCGAAN